MWDVCVCGGGVVSAVVPCEKQLQIHTPTHAYTEREVLVPLLVVWLGGGCTIMPLAVFYPLKPSSFITTITSPL